MSDTQSINPDDPLSSFTPPVHEWFRETFGEPTPPQAQGWPSIQCGDHTLILAPTGSGKTLTAFLWGIDQLFRELTAEQTGGSKDGESGVRIIYISPLKALNNDIHRNLRTPLAGIRAMAYEMDVPFPEIRVAVRSGDTPQRERRAMVRTPPHILITTPESMYLLLTSPKAREMLRTVHTVIVDEIHTLAGNKRGVHLSLNLERLQHMAGQPIQRIGLSATIQPLDEVARFLGGAEWQVADRKSQIADRKSQIADRKSQILVPRPVTAIDAHYRKPLDLKVVTPVPDFRHLPGRSVWPSVIAHVMGLIRWHQTTLIFCNSRRLAERTSDRLNEQLAAEDEGRATGLIEDGVVHGIGFMATGNGTHGSPIRAHHGSVSREARLQMEHDLKAGNLPALVATSSLELGIDIGSVDLVIQLQSPKSVAQGLQRVGRSGHLVGQTSKGRMFPTYREEVMEAAAVAGGMLRSEVEPTYTPRNPLDVLAQQIVAMVSVETWDVGALYDLVRQAYAYHDLSLPVFQTVLEMLAGRYPSKAHRELRARVAWDRVNNKLAALPGSRMLALVNGGTIPDRGTFGAYLSDGQSRLGELDEEFVYETRVGDVFMLGSQVWRVIDITDDRVLVKQAPGATPRMPFWRGDFPWRPYQLGKKIGGFRRAVAERLGELREPGKLWELRRLGKGGEHAQEARVIVEWLKRDYALDENSAWHVVDYVAGQLHSTGTIASDRTVVVEVFEDALGDPRMVVHSPFGGRVNAPWGLALAGALRERTGVIVEVMSNDDGILLRFPDADAEFPLDLVMEMTPAEARERILSELPDSAVFGAQFRQNAARALLLPGTRPGKRTPFWLQRLRAKDLLQVVRHFDDFPILIETYRDCLQDVMDFPHLEEILNAIQGGDIRVVTVESLTPSPVAQGLLTQFINVYLYEWDTPKAERQLQQLTVNRELLADLLKDVSLADLLKPEAVDEVTARLQHTAPTSLARSVEELAVMLQDLGDLSAEEIAQRCKGDGPAWLAALTEQGRIVEVTIPTSAGPARRWVAVEDAGLYQDAFAPPDHGDAQRALLRRFLAYSGPVTTDDILARYAFPRDWLETELAKLAKSREIVSGRFTPARATGQRGDAPSDGALAGEEADDALTRQPVTSSTQYLDRHNLDQIHRRTLTLLRQEVRPVSIFAYADFLARWQHMTAAERLKGEGALMKALQQLRGVPAPGIIWERDVLPGRLQFYNASELEAMFQRGEVVWVGSGGKDPRRARVRFVFRGEGGLFLDREPQDDAIAELSQDAAAIWDSLKSEGACFALDLEEGLSLPTKAVHTALAELVMAGLVTNDTVEAMRQVVRGGTPRDGERPRSALEAQLAERLKGTTRLTPGRVRDARRRVVRRLYVEPRWVGRWSLVHRFGVMGKSLPEPERIARQARQLLARWGVVTRNCLQREEGTWDWGSLYAQFRLMEMRGEVRRGYFVEGLPGVQFALPEAVENLRVRRGEDSDDETLVVLNACDPANPFGSEVPGTALRFTRVPSTYLVLRTGHPVLVVEGSGADLSTAHDFGEDVLGRALRAWLGWVTRPGGLVSSPGRVTVATWNGEAVLGSPGQALLEGLGFYRNYPAMTWEGK